MSNVSSGSVTTLPSECALDECYERFKLQLTEYMNEKCVESIDRKICQQWLDVFESATTEFQKVARNCFMVLMLEQFETFYTIGWPFTEPCNLDSNIEELWANLSIESASNIEELKQQQARMKNADTRLEGGLNLANVVNEKIKNVKIKKEEAQKNNDETARLRDTLNCLRVQYCEAKTKSLQLQEKIEQYELLEQDMFDKTKIEMLKDNVRNALQIYLDKLRSGNHNVPDALPMKVFENCFQYLLGNESDHRFYDAIRLCDIEFDVLLNSYFHRKYKPRLESLILKANRKLEKAKRSLHNKYTERLNFNAWASELQVKLIRMKCFSALRNIFIDMRTGDSIKMQTMMNLLEESCKAIFEEAK